MDSGMIANLRILVAGTGSERVSLILNWACSQRSKGRFRVARLLLRWLQGAYGVYIGPNAQIGKNVRFPHPVGIVIGDGVNISDDCTIYQNVTLGGARLGDAKARSYPSIGRGTVIFAGAVIVGSIEIAENCVIGANAFVNKDVPKGHVAVGVPAQFFRNKEVAE